MPEMTCAMCQWWKSGGAAGECRRRAPFPVLSDAATKPRESWPWARWPLTLADEWCGEFQPPPVKQMRE